MPQPYPILIEALAQIAASNDSDQISEIARDAARRILSAEAIAAIQAQGGLLTPIQASRVEVSASNSSGLTAGYLARDARRLAVDNPIRGSRGARRSNATETMPVPFEGSPDGYEVQRHTISEILAARTLASVASAAITRCANQAALASAKARLELERDEIRHRLKNVYASAIGLANLSLPKEYSKDFMGRLRTLAEVHQFLDGDNAETVGVLLGDVLVAVLSPYHDGDFPRIRIEGPKIEVSSTMAVTLGLVANELATNALKHGSLSVSSGQILVQWTSCDGELGLSWREIGGPLVDSGAAPNQGSKLMRMIVEGQLHGKMAQRLTPTGLLFSVLVPIT